MIWPEPRKIIDTSLTAQAQKQAFTQWLDTKLKKHISKIKTFKTE